MACLVGQGLLGGARTCATARHQSLPHQARHRRDPSVHALSNRGASYQSPEQTRSQVQKPIIRSRTENAVTPSETPIPSVKYVFIVEPNVGGGSSYICCCCCCGRSGGGGAAYFAGGGGGAAAGAGAGGRGGWLPARVRQAVRRAAVVRAAAAEGAACRAATRPWRSSVRPLRASIFVLGFDQCVAVQSAAASLLAYCPLHPQECGFWSDHTQRLTGKPQKATSQRSRPPLVIKSAASVATS